jgi:CheY-like chemotaxis protein
VAIPELEQLPVLVIEDNLDTLQLFRRYASGTRYRLITSADPEQALSLAEETHPRVILLDVMMPQVGGWKVLARLRQHPLTEDTPIVVCTILPQEELALALGASGYVRKPVTRQDFLTALDRQIRWVIPRSR